MFAGLGCGGDSTPAVDAPPQIDSGSGSAAACTGAVYDPCTDVSQCSASVPGGADCKLFNGVGLQVCTQTCTVGDNSTCPMQGGVATSCNNMGICKPNAANNCTR